MPYDIVDAYADIGALAQRLDEIVQILQEKGVMEKPKDAEKKGK